MSDLIIITCPMHKVAAVVVNVPVEFEVFEERKCFKAIPYITPEVKRLIQLPKVLSFTIKDSRIYSLHKKEVIEEIVNELIKLKVMDIQKKKVYKRQSLNHSCS